MAELVEKQCQDRIPKLEQIKRIKLFDKTEIRDVAEKLKKYEDKMQQYTKRKEIYLGYIQYETDLLKLIKQWRDATLPFTMPSSCTAYNCFNDSDKGYVLVRYPHDETLKRKLIAAVGRGKSWSPSSSQKLCERFGITQKKSDIEFAIRNKINNLYKEAISTFQDDIRFWIPYMNFCKHSHFHSNVSHMLRRMLQVHRNKPKCWQMAASWELKENNNKPLARQYLLRGLRIHPHSQLLYIEMFKLELDACLATASTNAENATASTNAENATASTSTENAESQEDNSASVNDIEMPSSLQTAYLIYQQAFDCIKDIKFIVQLLNIVKDYNDTEKLQKIMICDMIREYTHEPLMWDTMARCALQGLVRPVLGDTPMELDNTEHISLKDRILCCEEIYQTAVKKIKTEEIWTLYIDCLLEINRDVRSLPNFKRKLLKTALMQAHRAKKLNEGHYLSWIEMLISEIQRGTELETEGIEIIGDNENHENAWKQLEELLCGEIEAVPNSADI